jgi:hypothetical protein
VRGTEAGRHVAWFEAGELWCAEDATPPVSPAGWYVWPRGPAAVWVGPFTTAAEAAAAAPGGGDPLAAARRQLDAWLAQGGSAAATRGASIEAAAVVGRGHRRPAALPAPDGGPSGPEAVDEERAGARPRRTRAPSSRQDPGEPAPPRRKRGRAGGTPGPPDVSAAAPPPRQLAFGFGAAAAGGAPALSQGKGDARWPSRRERPSQRCGRVPGVQENLPF